MKFKLQRESKFREIKSSKEKLKKIIKCSSWVVVILFDAVLWINIAKMDFDFPRIKQDLKYDISEMTSGNYFGQVITDERKKILDEIQEILEQNFNSDLLQNYYRNVKTLKYHYNPEDIYHYKYLGYYNGKNNRIIEIVYNKQTFTHELIHMTCQDGDNCGFRKNNLGFGLNEGYTNYFISYYFCELERNSYKDETLFAEALANIIGIDKMNEAFLTTNQDILIDELVKIYGTKEDAIEFLKAIDKMNSCDNNEEKQACTSDAFDKLLNYGFGNMLKKDININDYYWYYGKDIAMERIRLLKTSGNLNLDESFYDMFNNKIIDYCLNSHDKYKYSNDEKLNNFRNVYLNDIENTNRVGRSR